MKKILISIVAFLALAPIVTSAQLKPGADGLIRPPGIESPTQCQKSGGIWSENTFEGGKPVGTHNIYQCGFTPEQYNKAFNITAPAANNPSAEAGNNFCTGGSCTYEPLEPLPYLPNKYGPENSFASAIPGIFKLLIGGGATIAVVMIVLGALTYMFSDIVGNKKKALDRIRGAMWAIVLLVSSYLILATINPDLVTFSLKLKTADNFMKSPDPIIDATPAQMTQDQYQAALNQCIQGGKTMHQRPDGTPICQ